MDSQYSLVPASDGKLYLQTPQGRHQPTRTDAAIYLAELIARHQKGEIPQAKVDYYAPLVLQREIDAHNKLVAAKDGHIESLSEEVAYLRTQNMQLVNAIASSCPSTPKSLPQSTSITVEIQQGDNRDIAAVLCVAIVFGTAFLVTLAGIFTGRVQNQPFYQPSGVRHERTV